jgi:hypothetical protein
MRMSFATRTPDVAQFGGRAARLNKRNADPEGCNFLRRMSHCTENTCQR